MDWANTQFGLGNAYMVWADFSGNPEHSQNAIDAYEEALTIYNNDRNPDAQEQVHHYLYLAQKQLIHLKSSQPT